MIEKFYLSIHRDLNECDLQLIMKIWVLERLPNDRTMTYFLIKNLKANKNQDQDLEVTNYEIFKQKEQWRNLLGIQIQWKFLLWNQGKEQHFLNMNMNQSQLNLFKHLYLILNQKKFKKETDWLKQNHSCPENHLKVQADQPSNQMKSLEFPKTYWILIEWFIEHL